MDKRMPTMAEEAAVVTERMGYYVPPWRLADLVKTASRVLNIIANSKTQCTYEDCKLILGLVEATLQRGSGGEETA